MKTSWRCHEDNFARLLEDVLKTSWRRLDCIECMIMAKIFVLIKTSWKRLKDGYLLKRGTIWNDLKQPTRTYNEQKTTWNDLQRTRNDLKKPTTTYNEQETTWNDPQQVRDNLQWPEPTYNKKKRRRETTNNKQILRLFYDMGQTVLFSNTFSTQHLVAIIRALLHGESCWKQRVKHLYIIMCIFTGYKIYFFLSGFRVKTIHKSQDSRERERLFF